MRARDRLGYVIYLLKRFNIGVLVVFVENFLSVNAGRSARVDDWRQRGSPQHLVPSSVHRKQSFGSSSILLRATLRNFEIRQLERFDDAFSSTHSAIFGLNPLFFLFLVRHYFTMLPWREMARSARGAEFLCSGVSIAPVEDAAPRSRPFLNWPRPRGCVRSVIAAGMGAALAEKTERSNGCGDDLGTSFPLDPLSVRASSPGHFPGLMEQL